MTHTKRASLTDLRKMKDAGDVAETHVSAKPVELDDGFWDDAVVEMPEPKTAISLRVDRDILDFFKSQGKGHLTRMHAVLRSYVDAQKRAENRE